MNSRIHERFPVNFAAKVTPLRNRENAASGHVEDISESGICVTLPLQLAPGDIVQLDVADCVLFGHVIYSNSGSPGFRTGIEVEQVLLGGTSLSQILHQTLMETMPDTPGLQPSGAFLG